MRPPWRTRAVVHRVVGVMTLDEAVALARRFHEGALDKGGRPYIDHPLRVMARVSTTEAKMAAALHDLVEDTGLSLTDLAAAGCPARVLQAVDALTRRSDETYDEFVRRAAADPLARVVKLADIADNVDPQRLAGLDPEEAARLRAKYEGALATIERMGVTGDPARSPFSVGEPDAGEAGPHAGFDCAACRHPAGRVELLTRRREVKLVATSFLGRSSFLVESRPNDLAEAIRARDAAALFRRDPEFTPFWCPQCSCSYCDRHWAREVAFDDGFYDCTYGTCPAGHRRMLDD